MRSKTLYLSRQHPLRVVPWFKTAKETAKAVIFTVHPIKKTVVSAHRLGNMLISSSTARHLSSSRAWVSQEIRKGNWPLLLPGNNEAGWRFEGATYGDTVIHQLPNGQTQQAFVRWNARKMREVPDSALRYTPFFSAFDNPEIVTDSGSAFLLANTNIYHRILADGIPPPPPESFATGGRL